MNRERVPSYKDFISVLAGKGTPQTGNQSDGQTYNQGLRKNGSSRDYKSWGRTFGSNKGPNGRPLCESKVLDTGFWYYDDALAPLTYAFDPMPSWVNWDCLYAWFFYTSTGTWKNAWIRNRGEIGGTAIFDATVSLEPGIYGAQVSCATKRNSSYIRVNGEYILDIGLSPSNSWTHYNAIFFVDSTSTATVGWNSLNCGLSPVHCMQCVLFRFTPPGYWKP